jgi:ABC-2 type transport system permease protein
MTPIRSMPVWMQALTYLNPLRYSVEFLRGSLLRDADLGELWTRMVALFAFGLLILGVASLPFHKRIK